MSEEKTILPATPVYLCPLCGDRIRWSCNQYTGIATCSNGPMVTRKFQPGEPLNVVFCMWEGRVERRLDGHVEIYY
jgi:hypothetical protein